MRGIKRNLERIPDFYLAQAERRRLIPIESTVQSSKHESTFGMICKIAQEKLQNNSQQRL